MSSLTVCNMTAVTDFNIKINLQQLADDNANFIKNKPVRKRRVPASNSFSGAVARFKDPKVTCLLFPNGKVVSVGAKCSEDISKTIDKLAILLHTASPSLITINNIVGSFSYGKKLNFQMVVEKFASINIRNIMAEDFPGLSLLVGPEKTMAIVFYSGKVIITGARDIIQLNAAYLTITKCFDEIFK